MAQGYLKLEGREDMELRGEKYFRNLASCSLFPDFQRNEFDGKIIRCQMHSIVHDFAQCLTESDSLNAEVKDSDYKCQLESFHEKVQNLMIMFESDDLFLISVYTQKKPRSLVIEREGYFIKGIVLSEVFAQLSCLRTLDLSNHDSVWCKVIEVVPRGIKGLIHLSWRSSLRNLPQGMGKLIKLRHGENVGTPLGYMPKGIERCVWEKYVDETRHDEQISDGRVLRTGVSRKSLVSWGAGAEIPCSSTSTSAASPISCKKHKAIPAVFLLRVDSRRPGQRQLARHALQPKNLGTKATQPPTTTEMGNPRSRGGRITDGENNLTAIRFVASVPRTFISDLNVGGFAPGKQPAYSDLSVCAGTSGEEALRGEILVVVKLIEQRPWS
ncbi:hypothetical protein WN943_022053 [Citrus x changshan-huyou]